MIDRRPLPPGARAAARALRRGFTLIELMAVIVIIGILAAFLLPNVTTYFEQANVQACSKNLQDMHSKLLIYKSRYKGIPAEGGVRFFAALYAKGITEQTEADAVRLTCPAVERSALEPAALGIPVTEWFRDLEEVTGGYSAYAGRDLAQHPLRKFPAPGTEPLICDDNDGGMNHKTTTNVLMGDGSIQTLEIFTLIEEGVLAEGETELLVGPDSPVELLQKFTLD